MEQSEQIFLDPPRTIFKFEQSSLNNNLLKLFLYRNESAKNTILASNIRTKLHMSNKKSSKIDFIIDKIALKISALLK